MTKRALTYRKSGVNIDEADRFISLIKPLAGGTRRKGVLGGIGGFGALFSGGFKGMKEPVLVASTDGVGTKLKVAFAAGRDDTIGVDLVAMCVNDIVTTGAEPLFFLDYLATARLDARKAARIVRGIARGCREAGCALIGGETAEMPGLYRPGEYDLAGFAVGVVDRKRLIDGSSVKAGDVIVGLASNGLHSNGYSLARKLFFERLGLGLTARPRGLGASLSTVLLRPTRIYVKTVLSLTRSHRIKGIAHITGGGITENIPRALPAGTAAIINKGSWPEPAVFRFIREHGDIDEAEMLRTFNCGIGMALVTGRHTAPLVIRRLKAMGERAYPIGCVAKKKRGGKTLEYV